RNVCPSRAAKTAGAGGRPVGSRAARLLLRRRQVCRRPRQGDHAGTDLCRGAGAEGRARPYPLVLIHGAAQTATNWMGTRDARKGWADYFVEQGYVVYMVDQPMRGRSAWHPSDGPTRMFTAQQIEFQFTANAVAGSWPQAK